MTNGSAMPADPVASGGNQGDAADSITVPKSVLGDRSCKPGEKLTFEVVDVDEDGSAEVKLAEDQGGHEDMGEGIKKEMSSYPMETKD